MHSQTLIDAALNERIVPSFLIPLLPELARRIAAATCAEGRASHLANSSGPH